MNHCVNFHAPSYLGTPSNRTHTYRYTEGRKDKRISDHIIIGYFLCIVHYSFICYYYLRTPQDHRFMHGISEEEIK